MFLLVNNRPIQSADSIGFWPIVSVSADSQNSTIGRPLWFSNTVPILFTFELFWVLFSGLDKRRGGRWCCVSVFIKRVKKAAMPTETVLIRENFFAHRTKSTKTSCILGTPLTSQTLLYTRLCWHTRTDWNAAVPLHTLSIQFHVHQWLLTLFTNGSEMRFVP